MNDRIARRSPDSGTTNEHSLTTDSSHPPAANDFPRSAFGTICNGAAKPTARKARDV